MFALAIAVAPATAAPDGTLVARFNVGPGPVGTATERPDGVVVVPSAAVAADQTTIHRLQDGILREFTAFTGTLLSPISIAPVDVAFAGVSDGTLRSFRSDGADLLRLPSADPIQGSPAIAADGTVYFGSTGGKLHAISPDGTEQWSCATGDWITASPTVDGADGTIYIGSCDGFLYALTLAGNRRWRTDLGAGIESTVAPGIDAVYVGTDGGELVALRPADGMILWRFGTGGIVRASPVIGVDGTVYVGSIENPLLPNADAGYFHAIAPDGSLRWRIRVEHGVISSAAIAADGSIVFAGGDGQVHAVNADGTVRWTYDACAVVDASLLIASDGTLCIGSSDGVLHVLTCTGGPGVTRWPMFAGNQQRTGRLRQSSDAPAIIAQPQPVAAAVGSSPILSVASAGAGVWYRWEKNGAEIAGATGAALQLTNISPTDAGLYVATAFPIGVSASKPAIVGIATTHKSEGAAELIGPNIRHPNGNIYDQVALTGAAASITADPGEVTRMSYVDPTDDIVQVEFSGAGTLTLVLENASGPATPVNYEQPGVTYLKGRPGVVITGADDTTNVSVFSVGRITAVNQALFRNSVTYDGLADLAYIAITSTNGQFGGIRTANARFSATHGLTGIYAPGVQFVGPVFIGNIDASDTATPVLLLGSAPDVRITGGDLLQTNGRGVKISGVTRLKFVDGTTSHGVILAAKRNAATLLEDGISHAPQIVVNPPAGPAADMVKYGAHVSAAPSRTSRECMAKLTMIGAQSARLDFGWDWMEPTRGNLPFEGMDKLIDDCRAAGIEPLMIINGSPSWANGSDDPMRVPTSEPDFSNWLTLYRGFVRSLALHYKGRVDHWELWNEPNVVTFWKPRPNVDLYARWATAIESEIRAVDPAAWIAFGSITCLHEGDGVDVIAGVDFLRGLYDRHIVPRIVSVHPYPDWAHANDAPETAPGMGRTCFRDVETIRQLMVERGGSQAEIWITEYAWWSGPSYFNPALSLTEEQQADYFSRSLALVQSWPYVRRAIWFWDWDIPGSELNGCGLVRVDGTLRPAALVLKNAQR